MMQTIGTWESPALEIQTITASSEASSAEGKEKAADGYASTKWLTLFPTGWLAYQIPVAKVVRKYAITSANDVPDRDPRDWEFQGSTNGTTWVTLDTRKSERFTSRFQRRTFTVTNSTPYAYYRLNITRNAGNTFTQIAEFSIYEESPTEKAAVTTAAAEAIASPNREVYARVLVDWNRNGNFDHPLSDLSPYLGEVAVDRSLAGAIPAEIMLIEGSAAAEMRFSISGDYEPVKVDGVSLPMTGVFSPYNGLSPFYNSEPIGADIKYQIGIETGPYGIVWYNQFMGSVRTITPNREGNEVAITALDRAETCRGPVELPLWAVQGFQAKRGYYEGQTLSSDWLIDHALKSGDTSSSRYRFTNRREYERVVWPEAVNRPVDVETVMVYVSGQGGYLPNVGILDNTRTLGFPWSEGSGRDMYARNGQAHEDVVDQVEAAGLQPKNLHAMANDDTGPVPRVTPATTSIGATHMRSYNLQYGSPWNTDLFANQNGAHIIGFTMPTVGDTFWSTGTQTFPVIEAFITDKRAIRIDVTGGQVRASLYRWDTQTLIQATSFVAIPSDMDQVRIDAAFVNTFTTSGAMRLYINGRDAHTSETAFNGSSQPNAGTGDRVGYMVVRHRIGMQDIVWGFTKNTFNLSNLDAWWALRRAKYGAILDDGKNKLTQIPATRYEDGWALMSDVASAEGGAIFYDEDGVFRFWNRDTIVGKQAVPVQEITLDNANQLSITNSADSVRNIITSNNKVATADQDFIIDASDPEQFFIPAASTGTIAIEQGDDTIMSVYAGKINRYYIDDSPEGVTYSTKWNDNNVDHGYVVEFRTNFTSTSETWEERPELVSGVDLNASTDGRGLLRLRVKNGYSYAARIKRLRIRGSKITRQADIPRTERDGGSIATYGPRNLELTGDWVQESSPTSYPLGNYLLPRTVKPIPATDVIQVAGDPRRQLGDSLDVRDPSGFGERIKVQILGISRTFSPTEGLTDSLSVEMIRPAGAGEWDSAQYGLWDQTFVWSP
jgi:hypothetical protein